MKKDKAPDSLGDVGKGIQDILSNTEKVEKIMDGSYLEEGEKKKEDKNTEENNEEKLLDTWKEIDKRIENVHEKWNGYEVEGVKKGLTSDRENKFEESLNFLTRSIEERKIKEIFDYGSKTMLYLGPIFELYRDELFAEINMIKHSVYQSYLKAMDGKEAEATDLLKNLDEYTNKIRLKLEKDDSKIKVLEKVSLAIEDMRKSLKESSIKLHRIKMDILIKNLEELGK